MTNEAPRRRDGRIIIHFDYDCFYAAVFEKEDPTLKSLPLAVQQKQIIVTCNYEARRRGLYKLQLVREAKKRCPDVIIVLGEDLTRFRNASKDNYDFLRSRTWTNKVERLGFDEVFMDVTDMIDYNMQLLNHHALSSSFFHLSKNDPTDGFAFDATSVSGHVYPSDVSSRALPIEDDSSGLLLRLLLGSHLAQQLRHQLEEQKGYTSTVGISTNKLLSKLVGNVNKPKGQTTLMPPYNDHPQGESNVMLFIDGHDIGKIPYIGFKSAQKIRDHVLGRPAAFSAGLVYGGTKENVKAGDVRRYDGMGPELLGRLLAGPGTPKDLGEMVWGLINGVDNSEVAKAKEVPQQISIEDSYIRLDEMDEVKQQLKFLSGRLLTRLRIDLTSSLDDEETQMNFDEDNHTKEYSSSVSATRKWTAFPRTLRLTTRPRPPLNPDGSRSRNFTRISKSTSMPSFIFSLTASVDTLVDQLVDEAIIPLFRKLHPERSGWNLSLVNVCATNMSLVGSDSKDGAGRDIGKMFRNQEEVLKAWRVDDADTFSRKQADNEENLQDYSAWERDDAGEIQDATGFRSVLKASPDFRPESLDYEADWDSEEDTRDASETCRICGTAVPEFAKVAHNRFHMLPD